MNVLLIAGHGNGDSGAIGNGYEEAELTREFAVLLKENLKSFCNVTLADTNRNWFEFLGSNNYDFSETSVLWGLFLSEIYFKLNPVAIPFATAVASLFLFF